ncbi:MAG TPA: DNA polymerase III subunit delta' [Mycobacteriales bacterium]|nr:DNA polymerase III subunit delta' [Mycobacteriales bacterium]
MSVFAQLIGQPSAVQVLQAAADAAGALHRGDAVGQGAMTHAWLFTGPAGSGRSVAARAFAAALQCSKAGCGECEACRQSLGGSHPDVAVIAPEGLHLVIKDARDIVARSSRAPTRGRWQVTLIEDADRMEERTSNTVLMALEEPPPHAVLLLSAPSTEDLLPTIRSRCRLVPLRTPPTEAVARLLVERDGVDPAMAAFAARASQGHIGRALRMATDEQARAERREVLSLPRSLAGVGSALQAAKNLVDAAQAEAGQVAERRDGPERAALATALGAGATGKGITGAVSRGGAAALKDLEKQQKSRGTRTQRDALDRALVDLAAFYRDVLTLQLRTGTTAVHSDLAQDAAKLAAATRPEATLRRIEAVFACREAIETNVAPLLAVEAMALALRTG